MIGRGDSILPAYTYIKVPEGRGCNGAERSSGTCGHLYFMVR